MFGAFEDLMRAIFETEGDEDNSLKNAMSEHKEPTHIFESAENVGLRAQILMLQSALVGFAEERELLAKEVERLQEKISKFEEENTRLWHENERFRSENRNLKGTLQQQDEEIARLQAMVSNLCAKLEAAHSEVDDDGGADESSASVGAETGGDESDGESEVVEMGESPEAGAGSSTSSTSMSFCVDK